MAVGTGAPLVIFTANGVTTVFAYPFTLLDASDIQVTIDGVTTGAYTLTGIGNASGGNVVFVAPPANLAEVVIARVMTLDRAGSDYQNNGDFLADTIDNDLDRIWLAIQESQAASKRSIRAPFPENFAELLDATTRAGKLLGFAGDGSISLSVPVAGSAAALALALDDATTAGSGDAMIGWSAVFAIVAGNLTRYATLAAAVAGVGASVCEIVVRGSTSLSASSTVPVTAILRIENGAVITTTGFVLTVNGPFICGRQTCFAGSGSVVFAKGSCAGVFPEWWGAKPDGVVADGTGTDCTSAFQSAITASTLSGAGAVGILPVHICAGNFVVGALTLPPAARMFGEGRHSTNLIAKPALNGKWITDTGSASKIILEGFAMYARSLAGITHGLQLGRNGTEHGTEGYVRDLWVRDASAAGAKGVDILSNVGLYDMLTIESCDTCLVIGGAPSHIDRVVIMRPAAVGADLSYCKVGGIHIEAPGNSCVPLKITRPCSIQKLSVSLANATTISHLMQLDAGATTWSIDGFDLFFGSTPASVTVSNGNFKRADGTYFGGNATAGNLAGVGNYTSENGGQKLQSFTLRITNTGGTLQHRIGTPLGNDSNFASKVNSATGALTNTPTGADGSTAMAAGGKIGSASTSIFWFDTASQKEADMICSLGDVRSDVGSALMALPFMQSLNINGVTQTRLAVQFYTAATGAAFGLTPANIGVGKVLDVTFHGYLS